MGGFLQGEVVWIALFWGALFIVAYVYCGYLLVLICLDAINNLRQNARFLRNTVERRKAPLKHDELPTVSILIAAHNEEAVIRSKIDNCLQLDYPPERLQILVGSDGSTDNTESIVSAYAHRRVQLSVGPRGGKASVLNRLAQQATGQMWLFTDANTWIEAGALKRLVAHTQNPEVGAVCGRLMLVAPGNCKLKGEDFGDAELQNSELKDSELEEPDLKVPELKDANVRGPDLRDSELRTPDLRDSDLRDSNLRGSALRQPDLMGQDLRIPALRAPDLRSAGLGVPSLRNADLEVSESKHPAPKAPTLKDAALRDAERRDGALNCSEQTAEPKNGVRRQREEEFPSKAATLSETSELSDILDLSGTSDSSETSDLSNKSTTSGSTAEDFKRPDGLRISQPSAQPTASNADEGLYWQYENLLKFYESRRGTLMGANGGLYLLRAELWEKLEEDTIVDDFVVTMRVLLKNKAVLYEPAALGSEETASDLSGEFRRRVRIASGNFQSLRQLSPLLWSASFASLAFWSHKVLRWMVPWFMLLLFGANLALSEHLVFQVFLAGQITFYLAALASRLHLSPGPLRPVFRFAQYFVEMNVALAWGLLRHLRGAHSPIWQRTERSSPLGARRRAA